MALAMSRVFPFCRSKVAAPAVFTVFTVFLPVARSICNASKFLSTPPLASRIFIPFWDSNMFATNMVNSQRDMTFFGNTVVVFWCFLSLLSCVRILCVSIATSLLHTEHGVLNHIF